MVILGIDPGLALLGWGVVEANGGRLKLLDYGVVETRAGTPQAQRLRAIQLGLGISFIFKRSFTICCT